MSKAKDIGSLVITRSGGAGAAAETAINGVAIDLTGLPTRPNSLRALVVANFNADSGDNLNVSAIKLQSSADSAFTTPVDRVTASNLVITGVTGDSNTDKVGQAALDYDILNHMAAYPTHKWLRLTSTPTRSDTTNTSAAVGYAFIFGGGQVQPAA